MQQFGIYIPSDWSRFKNQFTGLGVRSLHIHLPDNLPVRNDLKDYCLHFTGEEPGLREVKGNVYGSSGTRTSNSTPSPVPFFFSLTSTCVIFTPFCQHKNNQMWYTNICGFFPSLIHHTVKVGCKRTWEGTSLSLLWLEILN